MKKRILSIFLILTMMLSIIPITASADNEGSVYISVSNDSQYVLDKDGNPIAYTAITIEELASVDLDTYGLADFSYDADGDGVYEITALHLYIYVHENVLGLDFSEVGISGGAGSLYFYAGLFGFSDENLRYDYNGAYPAIDGWGLTADQIVLKNGDFLNIAHYTSWAFWGDSTTGFHYFATPEGELAHTYSAYVDTELQLSLVRSYSDWMNGGIPAFAPEMGYEVYYGTSYGTPTGTLTTDENGIISVSFPTIGTWYVWADGGYGMENPADIVSAPSFATVTVSEDPDVVLVDAVEEKISSIGTVTKDSGDAIKMAREAYDALTEAQKKLVENYDTLVSAEKAFEEIGKDINSADSVEALISALGTITVHSGNKVRQARTAYNALTDSQKQYVENLSVLAKAENDLAILYTAASNADHKAIYEATVKYINGLGTPTVGSTGGEWMVIDLTRSGYACPEGYYENVVDYVKSKINDKEQLHRAKSTDNSRVILALTSAGYDVTDVAGHNLLMGLTDMTYVKKQGINGPIWALIAFDCYGYDIPVNEGATEQVTREKLIAYILEKQLEDGGWALSGKVADPDMTGMAIQSLAPYYNTNAEVKAAVDKALTCLSEKQYDNGGFGSVDGTCSESCAQVIVALTSLGIDPEEDERFIKNGMSVLDAMCLFAVEGGGFAHIPDGGLNGMATEQSAYALASYFRLLEGETSLYDMSDVELIKDKDNNNPETGENITAYMVMILVSVMGAAVISKKRKTF